MSQYLTSASISPCSRFCLPALILTLLGGSTPALLGRLRRHSPGYTHLPQGGAIPAPRQEAGAGFCGRTAPPSEPARSGGGLAFCNIKRDDLALFAGEFDADQVNGFTLALVFIGVAFFLQLL